MLTVVQSGLEVVSAKVDDLDYSGRNADCSAEWIRSELDTPISLSNLVAMLTVVQSGLEAH